MNEKSTPQEILTNENERPIIITIICIIGFLGALGSINIIFSESAITLGATYMTYLMVSIIVGLFCMVGFWKMKKWAVYTYAGMTAFGQGVLVSLDLWSLKAFIVPAIIILIVSAYIDRMT